MPSVCAARAAYYLPRRKPYLYLYHLLPAAFTYNAHIALRLFLRGARARHNTSAPHFKFRIIFALCFLCFCAYLRVRARARARGYAGAGGSETRRMLCTDPG